MTEELTEEQRIEIREDRKQRILEARMAIELDIDDNIKLLKKQHLASNGANNQDLLLYMLVTEFKTLNESLKALLVSK